MYCYPRRNLTSRHCSITMNRQWFLSPFLSHSDSFDNPMTYTMQLHLRDKFARRHSKYKRVSVVAMQDLVSFKWLKVESAKVNITILYIGGL